MYTLYISMGGGVNGDVWIEREKKSIEEREKEDKETWTHQTDNRLRMEKGRRMGIVDNR